MELEEIRVEGEGRECIKCSHLEDYCGGWASPGWGNSSWRQSKGLGEKMREGGENAEVHQAGGTRQSRVIKGKGDNPGGAFS